MNTEPDRQRPGRQGRRRRVPQHRRPVRAARVDGPPMVAGRPGAARAVAVPTRRGQRRAGRPGIAGPAGAAADHPGHGLNLLAGAAVRLRDSFDISDAVWSLIGFFANGRLLPLRARCAAEIRVRRGLAMPDAAPSRCRPKPAPQAKRPSHRRPSRHPADQDVDSRLHLRRCLQPQVQRRSTPIRVTGPSAPVSRSGVAWFGAQSADRPGRGGVPRVGRIRV